MTISLPISGRLMTAYVKPTNAALTVLSHATEAVTVHHFWITEYAGTGTTIFVYVQDPSAVTYRILPSQTIGANLRVEWSTSFVIPKGWALKTDAGADSILAMGITYSVGSATTG